MKIRINSEQSVKVRMVSVDADMVAQKQKNKQCPHHTHGQANDIQQRVRML